MDRIDFVLLWKENNIIFCNQNQCHKTKSYRDQLPDGQGLVTKFCPIDASTTMCNRGPKISDYNNKTCIPIATLKDCKARQHGCTKECHTCMITLVQRLYHEKKI